MQYKELKEMIGKMRLLSFPDEKTKEKTISALVDLETTLADEEIYITVVGEFSTGKSTFLNAMIGRDLLPHAQTETTATITYIHNVPEHDPLANKIRVCFANEGQTPLELDFAANSAVFKDYLTTESTKYKVAQDITSVHIYCKMSHFNGKVTLIDTPGLNGMTDNHSLLTMNEIAKAHASICLFQIRSISASSLEMLRLIFKYQQRFLFVLNFIDQLRISEGETPDGKLNSFIAQLREKFCEDADIIDMINEETCFAISSLYALAGTDDTIERLYEGDTEPITPNARQQLLEKSRIQALKERLWQMAFSGREQFLTEAVRYKLTAMLNRLKHEISLYHLRSGVDLAQQQRLEVSEKLREQEESLAQYRHELENFVVLECKLLTNLMSDRIEQEFSALHQKTLKEIDAISNDNIEKELRTNNFKAGIIAKKNNLLFKFDDMLSKMLDGVYQKSLRKADSFGSDVRIKNDGTLVFVKIEKKNTELQFHEQLAKYEEKETSLNQKLHLTETEKELCAAEIARLNREINDKEQAKRRLETTKNRDITNLGRRPASQTKYVTKTRTVERSRFNPFRYFCSKYTTEEYEDAVQDDSKGQRWDIQKSNIEKNHQMRLLEYNQAISQINLKIKQNNNKALNAASTIKSYTDRLNELIGQKQLFIDEQKLFREKAYIEFCALQRKQMRADVENFFTKVSRQTNTSLQQVMQCNQTVILETVGKHYQQLHEQYMEKLRVLLAESPPVVTDEKSAAAFEAQVAALLEELT